MSKAVLLSFFFLSSYLASAQEDRIFSKDQLTEDFQFLKKSFDTYNPAIGVFHNKDAYEHVYDSLLNEITEEMTDLQFYPFVVKLAEATKEGHTSVANNSDTVTNIF